MKRIVTILIIFACVASVAIPAEEYLYIESVSRVHYPASDVFFLHVDESGNPVYKSPDSYTLMESGNPVSEFSYTKPEETPGRSMKHILAVNISEGISNYAFDLAKYACRQFNRTADFSNEDSTAIYSYNTNLFVNQTFENKKTLLDTAVARITERFGGVSLDSLFFASPGGVFTFDAADEINLTILTDGRDAGDYSKIRDILESTSFRINVIALLGKANPELRYLTEISGGKVFEKINGEKQIDEAVAIIRNIACFDESGHIRFTSQSCREKRVLHLSSSNPALMDMQETEVASDLLSRVNYPNGNIITFGMLPKGATNTKLHLIEAVGDTILIDRIDSEYDNFEVLNALPIQVPAGDTAELEVRYTSQGPSYLVSEFTVYSTACRNYNFFAKAGNGDFTDNRNDINIIAPEAGTTLLIGEDVEILSDGLLPTQRSPISYSVNAGREWKLLDENSVGGRFLFENIPPPETDSCLFKVERYSENKDPNKIITLDVSGNSIIGLCVIPERNAIATASIAGDIKFWDLTDGTFLNSLPSNIEGLNSILSFPGNDSLIAYTSDNSPDIHVFNIDSMRTEYVLPGAGGNISALSDNTIENLLLAGTEDGRITMWDFVTRSPIFTVNAHQGSIDRITFNPSGTRFASSSGAKVRTRSVLSGDISLNIEKFKYNVESLSYSHDSETLAIALSDNKIKFWDTFSGIEKYELETDTEILCAVRFAPDTLLTAEAGGNKKVSLRDLETKEIVYDFEYHSTDVCAVRWFYDSDGVLRIATGDKKGFVKIWRLWDIPFYNNVLRTGISSNYIKIERKRFDLRDIEFGNVPADVPKRIISAEAIKNITSVPTVIDSVVIAGDPSGVFRVLPVSSDTVPVNGFSAREFVFLASEPGDYSAHIEYYSGRSVFRADIHGKAVVPSLTFEPVYLDFGMNEVASSPELSVRIKNNSPTDIQVDSIMLIEAGAEHFQYLGADSFTVPRGESLDVPFSFNPSIAGEFKSTALAFFRGDNSPYPVSLVGEAVKPDLSIDSELVFEPIECIEGDVNDSVLIRNVGDKSIDIIAYNFDGIDKDYFYSDQSFPMTIPENSGEYFGVVFSGSGRGEYYARLKLIDNSGNTYNVNLKATVEEYKIEFSDNPVDFEESYNTQGYKKISVENTGSLDYIFNFPYDYQYFRLDCISGNVLKPGEKTDIDVIFKGADHDTSIVFRHSFTDPCSENTVLTLTAKVGKSDAIADIPERVDLGDVLCSGDSADVGFSVSNSGSTNWIISDLSVSGNEFEILSYDDNIAPGESGDILIRFRPSEFGLRTALISGKSNADNYPSGDFEIICEAHLPKNNFDLSADTLHFENVPRNTEARKSFFISNNGEFDNTYFVSYSDNFSMPNGSTFDIAYSKSYKAEIVFLGGPGSTTFIDSLKVTDVCGKTKTMILIVDIIDYPQAVFEIPEIEASSGDTVHIPVLMKNPYYPDFPPVSGWDIDISFNATLMYDFQEAYIDTFISGRRVVKLRNLPPKPPAGDTLALLTLLAATGDAGRTDITFDEIVPLGKPAGTASVPGRYVLLGLCEPGGLSEDTGILTLRQNFPNPCSEKTEISFSLIEDGEFSLELYSSDGVLIGYLIKDENALPGEYKREFDISRYPPGVYYYVLKTRSQTRMKKMMITE